MAKLNIQWTPASVVAPKAVTTGMTEEESAAAAQMQAEKPMLIWIQSDDPTDKITRKLESVVFAGENVAVGTKFFKCIKITAGDALQDRILKEEGRATPRLILMDRDYKVTKVLQGKGISGGKLLKAMKLVVRKEYVTSFDKMVRGYIKLLNDLDRLDSRRAKLADDRARLQAKPNRSKEKKIERDQKKYEKDVEAWQKEEEKLLALRQKGEKKPEA